MITELQAVEIAARIRGGALTSVDIVSACLERIEATDASLHAWAYVDGETALARAREMDTLRQKGFPLGALHGVPIGLAERFETRGAVVERLQEAGAIVIGKTRTAEAEPEASLPANPHDQRHAAGRCGASAAVAGSQVPLAVEVEGNGALILAASFCGVFALRPTRGIISRRGASTASSTLDQVGVLGRCLEDVAMLSDALGGYDASDTASYLRPRPRMLEGCRANPPVEPDFIWLETPDHESLSNATQAGFEELRNCLAGHVERLPAPQWLGQLPVARRIIDEYESAIWLQRHQQSHPDLDAHALEAAARGAAHGEDRYQQALSEMGQAQAYFVEFFHDYDAIIAPAAAGEAPELASGTSDPVTAEPIFSTPWALCGLPCLSVPLLEGETGLPIGVQLVGSAEGDDRLLRSANWMVRLIRGESAPSDSDN